MNNIERSLADLGLSEKEARVYMAILRLGQGSAYKIAQKADIKIPTAYVVLEDLRKKDLVLKVPHSKKQIYVVKSPEDFVFDLKEKLGAFELFLPHIKKAIKDDDESKIFVFDGYDGLEEALDYKIEEMKGKSFKSFYSHLPHPDPKVIDIYERWNKKVFLGGVVFKVIMPDSEGSMELVKKLPEKYSGNLKLVDIDKWSSEISIEVGRSFVRIISSEDLQVVVVDNKKVARALEQIFDLVWAGAGEVWRK